MKFGASSELSKTFQLLLVNDKGFHTFNELRNNDIKIVFDDRNTPKDQRQINHRRAILLNCPAIEEAYATEVGRRKKTGGAAISAIWLRRF